MTGIAALDRILKQIKEDSTTLHQQQATPTNLQKKKEKEQKSYYKCPYCKDTTWVIEVGKGARRCKCYEVAMLGKQWEDSGLKINDLNKTFKSYEVINEVTKELKSTATNYYLKFKDIERKRNNSILLCGDPGAGKTHLCIALANNFLKKDGRKVVYMAWVDAIKELKQSSMDKEAYNKAINKYKEAEILLIDDLYKGGITEADTRIAFEIINHRYINNLPIMVSSEYKIKEILNVDEAVGSRIYEMAKGFIVEVKGNGTENNYRLRDI